MEEISKQLKKGVIEILVLKLLSLRDMYGYELIQALEDESQGVFKVKEGTLYPVMYRLEDNIAIESYWEQGSEKRGVPRKYYKITKKGKEQLIDMVKEWNFFIEGANKIINKDHKSEGIQNN